MTIQQQLSTLNDLLKSAGNEEDSKYMKAYLKGQFEFYGLKSKPRREVFRNFWKENGLPAYEDLPALVEHCMKSEYRELHYYAMDTCERMKKQWKDDFLPTIEHLITRNSWWDTVDFVADNIAGKWFQKFPDQMEIAVRRWNKSDHMWLNRSSIIFQLKYRENTHLELLEEMIQSHTHSNEFFLKKAIGWALRQYARTNPMWVVTFVSRHELKPLSEREAMKHLK